MILLAPSSFPLMSDRYWKRFVGLVLGEGVVKKMLGPMGSDLEERERLTLEKKPHPIKKWAERT